jgi:hypothetical protein
MRMRRGFWEVVGATAIVVAGALAAAPDARAFCGCDKPPPALAMVRPAFGHAEQSVTLFDERLAPGERYKVVFTSRGGDGDWSLGRATRRRDMADGRLRTQVRVAVPELPMGPAAIAVHDAAGTLVYEIPDDEFTIIAPPLVLHDVGETITEDGYQTGVAADGTVYVALDMSRMNDATTYAAVAEGFDLRFDGAGVAVFNTQGVIGEVLDRDSAGLFRITPAATGRSAGLTYWRHEFTTYREQHRKRDERMTADGEWHVDGTRHIDNDHLVVAIAGTLADGRPPRPGATPPFRLTVTSTPAPANPLE